MPTRKRVKDKQRFGCIYLLTNLITLLCYVGKTIDFEARMYEHKNGKSIDKSYVERSIRKHGWHNFKVEILIDDVPEEDLNNLETCYIAVKDTMRPNGYNLTEGGEGTRPDQKHIGCYFTKEKGKEALTHFLKTGERVESDTTMRKQGTGGIRKSKNGKRFKARYFKNKKYKSKTFDTPEECEEWLKTETKQVLNVAE